MYTRKLTKSEKESRFVFYTRSRSKLEEHPTIIAWKEFLSAPPAEKARRHREWDEYYEKVKDSVSYQVFQEQKEAASRGEWGKVKDLARQVREMRESGALHPAPMPKHIDPWELENGSVVKSYKEVEKTIKNMVNYDSSSYEVIQEGSDAFS